MFNCVPYIEACDIPRPWPMGNVTGPQISGRDGCVMSVAAPPTFMPSFYAPDPSHRFKKMGWTRAFEG